MADLRRSSPYIKQTNPVHVTIDDKIDGRLIILGDVHGCYDELVELLEKCKYNPSKGDRVVLAGDLVNKGPKSKEVVEYSMKQGFWAVKGNHDDYVVLQRDNFQATPPIVNSNYEWTKQLSDSEANYLRNLPYTLSFSQFDTLVVHAGVMPTETLQEQGLATMYKIRNILERVDEKTGEIIERIPTEDHTIGKPWASLWATYVKTKQRVVFGHDAIRKLQKYERAWGLDTGAVYGFHLTALILPSEELVQVQSQKQYSKPKYD